MSAAEECAYYVDGAGLVVDVCVYCAWAADVALASKPSSGSSVDDSSEAVNYGWEWAWLGDCVE